MKGKILFASAVLGLLAGFSCTPREIRAADRSPKLEQKVNDDLQAGLRCSGAAAEWLVDPAYAVDKRACAECYELAK